MVSREVEWVSRLFFSCSVEFTMKKFNIVSVFCVFGGVCLRVIYYVDKHFSSIILEYTK